MKKLLTNSKSNVVRNLGLALLLITPIVMATSCKKDEVTCDYEKSNLDAAKTEETRINNDFNVNADSCIHYWAPQMPSAFVTAAYNNLQNVGTAPYTKQDSVTVLANGANDVLPAIPESDPKYLVLKGISRTGGNALTAWDAYLNAKTATQVAQTAYTDCQNSN